MNCDLNLEISRLLEYGVQQELIAHLFGVSDERIHEDLARVILSR